MAKFFMLYKNCSYYKALDYLDLFYRHAKLKKTTFEIYQYALKLINQMEIAEKYQKKAA